MRGRIEIVGSLGVGKTTLLRACQCQAIKLGIGYAFEDLDAINEERRFWKDKQSERTYFIQTVYYLYSHHLILATSRSNNIVVTDFSLLFHHYGYSYVLQELQLLSPIEYRALEALICMVHSDLPQLLGMIHCTASNETIMKRIVERNRPEEKDINTDFLARLSEAGTRMLSTVQVPVLSIALDGLNFNNTGSMLADFIKEVG